MCLRVYVFVCVCVLTRVLFFWLNCGVLVCLLSCSRRLIIAAKSWRQMAMYTDRGLQLLPDLLLSTSPLSCRVCLLRYPNRSDVTVAITEWQYCSGETCSSCIQRSISSDNCSRSCDWNRRSCDWGGRSCDWGGSGTVLLSSFIMAVYIEKRINAAAKQTHACL